MYSILCKMKNSYIRQFCISSLDIAKVLIENIICAVPWKGLKKNMFPFLCPCWTCSRIERHLPCNLWRSGGHLEDIWSFGTWGFVRFHREDKEELNLSALDHGGICFEKWLMLHKTAPALFLFSLFMGTVEVKDAMNCFQGCVYGLCWKV